ncbi:TolC family protein [Brucepastera parasyntrophica]|uniref:TolC family protein n=1 Tax=Brucepastera parasyntrophica TaxID=2880008 RepID=UPI00210E3762|nr:TolC family protein [Brucepastera parasyntrophica]ULQ58680.1 TolC family protein [Brucepastera parasyntrophica]
MPDLAVEDIDFSWIPENPGNRHLPPPGEIIAYVHTAGREQQLLTIMDEIADLQFRIARGSAFANPDIGLSVDVSFTTPYLPGTSGFGNNWQWNVTTAIGISSTFFDGGKSYREMKIQKEKQNISRAEHRKKMEEIDRTIYSLHNSLITLCAELEFSDLQLAHTLQEIEQKKNEWETGYTGETEYLMKQLDYYSALTGNIQQQISFYANYCSLLYLSGKNILDQLTGIPEM